MKNLITLVLLSFLFACNGGSGSGTNSGNNGSTNNNGTENPQDPGTPPTTDDEEPSPTPPPPLDRVLNRTNIYSWDINGPEMAAYKRGIEVMKSRPANDPTSWTYQAAIHGSDTRPAQTGWNQCQHQSFFFLSWHRMYLYYFERILREASGDPNFALPYWDYSIPDQRALPEAFRVPADNSNPLYVANRNTGINLGFDIPESATVSDAAFTFDNFSSPSGSPLSFGGQEVNEFTHFGSTNGSIEQTPHNVVHVIVGGPMNDPNEAAADPIFWLHHANIDRLWNQWLDESPLHQNPVDNEFWMNNEFTFFDENGQQVTMSGKDIVDSEVQLGYRYEGSLESRPVPANSGLVAAFDSIPTKKVNLMDKTLDLEIKTEKASIPVKLTNKSKNVFNNIRPGESKPKRMVLNLENITYQNIPSGYYEVYLNLPENIENPDFKSDFYVGNIAFFGLHDDPNHDDHAHSEGKSVNFEITELFKAQLREGHWDFNNLNLSFYLKGVVAPDGTSQSILERIKPEGNIKIGKVTLDSYE